MKQLAQGIASLGRGEDKMLVHMTPGEVAGLQRIAMAHGGSLTINPQTGLAEAGFLSDILGFAAPIVGGMLGGPMGAGLASGLVSYAKEGDVGKALGAGALSFGGASLLGGLKGVGENALGNSISSEAQGAADIANQTALQTSSVPSLGTESGITPDQLAKNAAAMDSDYASAASGKMPSYMNKVGAGFKQATSSGQNAMDFLSNNKIPLAAAGLGLAGMIPPPAPPAGLQDKTGYSPQYTYDPKTQKYIAAAPMSYTYKGAEGGEIPGFAEGVYIPQSKSIRTDIYGSNAGPIGESGRQMYKNTDKYAGLKAQLDKMSPSMLSRLSKGGTDSIVQAAATTELYDRANTANSSYMDQPTMQAAQGGIMGMAGGGLFSDLISQVMAMEPTEAKAKQYSYDPNGQRYTELAQGGVASLPNEYAAGGKLLQGPGDGMSDSIPAVIKGPRPQRAALAQGEFVLPADVVSHLGNGSTDAGSKRLYAMMDKIRHARTGNKKQGKQINPNQFLPA